MTIIQHFRPDVKGKGGEKREKAAWSLWGALPAGLSAAFFCFEGVKTGKI